MANYKSATAALGVLTLILAASTGYLVANPTTTTQISTITQTPTVYAAVLIGANDIPPITTTATGTAIVSISPDGKSLHFVVTVNGITNVTLSHIHDGPIGQNNPVVVPFFNGPTKTGTFSGVLVQGNSNATLFVGPLAGKTMTDLINDIKAGRCYVNVHTTAHPGGEIRGFLYPVA